MRHRYDTRGIILARSPLGEANALVTVLASELGVVRARAQGVRRPGAKLATGLATFSESSVILVRGKEGWRLAGALLEENWFRRLTKGARERAARICGLLVRLAPSDTGDDALFSVFRDFLRALADAPEDLEESAEILGALRILALLGLDAGALPDDFSLGALREIEQHRSAFVSRVNRGILASEL